MGGVHGKSISRVILMALLCGGAVGWLPPHARAGLDDAGWIPFNDDSGHIAFSASVNGQPAQVILDSGADVNLISTEFAVRAGIGQYRRRNIRVSGVHGTQHISLAQKFELAVGEQKFPMHDVPIAPGEGFDVILGRWLFNATVVQIDYPNRRFRFVQPDAMNFEGNIRYRPGASGEPLVEARIHGKRAWLLVDTGNSGVTVLKRRFVERHGLDAYRIEGAAVQSHGVITSGTTQLLQLEQLEFGPFRLDRFLAGYIPAANQGVSDHRQRSFSRISEDRSREDGWIGYELLQNFIITMDLERRKIHFALPQSPAE